MTKICLIEVDGGEKKDNKSAPLSTYNVAEPLGLLCLESWLKENGYETILLHPKVYSGNTLTEEDIINEATLYEPAFIGFSVLTNQVPATFRIATTLKQKLPWTKFIVGGDHFSSKPEDILFCDAIDYAICGEGEEVLLWLLKHCDLLTKNEIVPSGVYWKLDGRLQGTGKAKRISNIDDLPIPTRYPNILKNSRVGILMYPPPSQQTGMASFFASRGCPFNCSYCSSTRIWGRNVVWRSAENIADELYDLSTKFKVNTGFFIDLTFNSDIEKVKEICNRIIKKKIGIYWYVMVRIEGPTSPMHVDRELLLLLKKAGCIKVGFGVETISNIISNDFHRRAGNDQHIIFSRWLDEIGILSKSFFIIGHPSENEEYYENLKKYLMELSTDEVRISYLTPFPGTKLWESYESSLPGIENYNLYTTFQPLLPNKTYSLDEIKQIRKKILIDYYFSKNYSKRVEKKISVFPEFEHSFKAFFDEITKNLF
jgi:anaerobic magnesium-protoporphyrin IX monomethyl ester cyclase